MKEKGTKRPRRADVEIQFNDMGPLMPGCSVWFVRPLTERGLELVDREVDWNIMNLEDVWGRRGVCGETIGDLLLAAEANEIEVTEAPAVFVTYDEESA